MEAGEDMTQHPRDIESKTRRRLMQAGAAFVPMMVTIKGARAQVIGQPSDDMLASIACLTHSELPTDYQLAVDEVARTLGLSPSQTGTTPAPQISPEAVPQRPGGWIGQQMARSNLWSESSKDLSTQADGDINYAGWTYEDFQTYFQEGRFDFYTGVKYNPGSQYHNTFLEITMSTACWNSIQNQMT
jgi:hypothetical protein